MAVARDLIWGDDHAPGARFVFKGSYPAGVEIPYQEVFRREPTLPAPRDCTIGYLRTVLDLVTRGLLPLRDLISEVAAPQAADRIYAELGKPDTTWVTAAFRWTDPT